MTKNDEESNRKVMVLVGKSKELEPDNLNVYKAEIIAMLRLNDKISAMNLIDEYVSILNTYDLDEIRSDEFWNTSYRFIRSEKRWSNQVKMKLSCM